MVDGGVFEVLGYFVAFWMFVGSPEFRRSVLRDFAKARPLEKIFHVFEALLATFFGLAPLALLIWGLSGLFG